MQTELRKEQGLRVSRKRIGKLLKKHGLNAKQRRKQIPATKQNHGLPVCENILNRDFHATEPGEKWVSDITYLCTAEGRLYLTMVMDLFGRKVIRWAFNDGMTAEHTAVPAFAIRPGRAILRGIIQKQTAQRGSGGQAKHEPEGELRGQRLCRELFQNLQKRT